MDYYYLYLAGVLRSNHLNLEVLWLNDGLSPEYFRAVMPKARFYILLRAMRFDDKVTRAQGKQFDKLAAIRSVFEDLFYAARTVIQWGQM